jgi:hypothetical protein
MGLSVVNALAICSVVAIFVAQVVDSLLLKTV